MDDPLAPFAAIHDRLALWKYDKQISGLVDAVAHMQLQPGFVEVLRADKTLKAEVQTEADLVDRATRFMYFLLFARRFHECSVLLWGEPVFTPKPHFVNLIWDGIKNHNIINILGASSTGKSYGAIAWILLDWVTDPEWTKVLCIGPDSDHLSRNMWGDLSRLHTGSVIPLPGKMDTESLSTDKRRGMGFFTIALDRGERESAKIKGTKNNPRDGHEHPIFGRDSRLRVLVDEAQQVPPNVFKQILNLMSNQESIESLKIIMSANPSDEYSSYGKNCIPPGGLQMVTMDTETWLSTTGWWCVRLNAMKCENVVQGRIIFPRLVDIKKVNAVIAACNGDDQHPDVWTFVYGMFPPQGALTTLIRNEWIREADGEWVFDRDVHACAALDPALQGADMPAFAYGRFGRAVAWRRFDDKLPLMELEEPMYAIQVDGVTILPKGDTQSVADEAMDRCIALGVKPEHFGMDSTGNGQGVADTIVRQWAKKLNLPVPAGEDYAAVSIIQVNYSNSPTKTKIAEEDTKTPYELYDRVATELYYAAARFFELKVIKLGRAVDPRTKEELSSRRGGRPGQKGKKQTIESKEMFKKRNQSLSPDRGDAVTLIIHVARSANGEIRPRQPKTPVDVMRPLGRDPWSQTVEEKVTSITGLDQETCTSDFVSDGAFKSTLDWTE